MSSSLYVLFDVGADSPTPLSQTLCDVAAPGYSVYEMPLKKDVCPPGEPSAPVRCTLYAGNYFRVFVADRAIEFYQEVAPSQDILDADERLRKALLNAPGIQVRRWVRTEEGWDHEDEPFVHVVDEGHGPDWLRYR